MSSHRSSVRWSSLVMSGLVMLLSFNSNGKAVDCRWEKQGKAHLPVVYPLDFHSFIQLPIAHLAIWEEFFKIQPRNIIRHVAWLVNCQVVSCAHIVPHCVTWSMPAIGPTASWNLFQAAEHELAEGQIASGWWWHHHSSWHHTQSRPGATSNL